MRTLICAVVGLALCTGTVLAEKAKDTHTITGKVVKVEAKSEHEGTLVVSGEGGNPADKPKKPAARAEEEEKGKAEAKKEHHDHVFHVDATTKILGQDGKDLPEGLKSEHLKAGAEVAVTFAAGPGPKPAPKPNAQGAEEKKDNKSAGEEEEKGKGHHGHHALKIQLK